MLRPEELSDTGLRQLRKMMNDLDLRVAAIRFPTRRGYDVLQDLDRRIAATKAAMRMAYRLGARVLINAVGHVPQESSHPGYEQLASSLTDLARYGQHVGAMLACETGSEPAPRLNQLLTDLPEQAIGVAFNPGNLIVNDFYDEDSIVASAARTLVVIARDGVRDLARGRGIEVPLGRGSAEFARVLGVLEEQQYRDWFVIDRIESRDPVTEIGHAVSYLQSL